MYTSTLQCGGLKCHVDDEMSCGGIKSGLKNKNVVIAADNDNLIYNTLIYILQYMNQYIAIYGPSIWLYNVKYIECHAKI